jgi:hypothetical protein
MSSLEKTNPPWKRPRRALLEYRGESGWRYRVVLVLRVYENSWWVWSFHEPFTRVIHKNASWERVVKL